jgi:hypothetical protein
VSGFVHWYNTHPHSALNFVTADDHYHGRDKALLAAQHQLYQRARRQHPHRRSEAERNDKDETLEDEVRRYLTGCVTALARHSSCAVTRRSSTVSRLTFFTWFLTILVDKIFPLAAQQTLEGGKYASLARTPKHGSVACHSTIENSS